MDLLAILDEFERAWADGGEPDTAAFVRRLRGDADGDDLPPTAVDLFAIELEKRWQRPGTSFRFAEDYARAYPALSRQRDLWVAVVVVEYEERHKHGDRPAAATYQARFPDQWSQLAPALQNPPSPNGLIPRDNPTADVLPVFSPDGKKLMWTSNRTLDHSSQLWIGDFKLK